MDKYLNMNGRGTVAMNHEQAMQALEGAGTAQNRKIYARHGANDNNMFGVSSANLKKLKKQIKIDHALAQKLWASGNHDARILAMKIADPKMADGDTLETWVQDLGDYIVTDALSEYISKTGLIREEMEAWVDSEPEWISTTGWNLLGYLAMKDKSLTNDFFEAYLDIIASDIHNRQNRVRYAMNNALIWIGTRNEALESLAIAVAAHIGEVIVDHGEASCQTPDAAAYIQKTRARQKA